jgi:hypothetical protein
VPDPWWSNVEAAVVPSLEQLDLTVIGPSGAEVAVKAYARDLQYDRAGGVGTAVGTFTASESGEYQVFSGASRTADVVAVGADIGNGVINALGRAGLICGLALVAGLALAGTTLFVARS